MGYEYVFDAQPTVNGTDIKDITINGSHPDEVYCNGSHIAHLKKDVTVGLYHLYLVWTGDFSHTDYSISECGKTTDYYKYYAHFKAYCAIVGVDNNSISTGKRIKKIEYSGRTLPIANWQSGSIEYPETGDHLQLLGEGDYGLFVSSGGRDFLDDETPLNTTCYLSYRTANKITITYTDGTTKNMGWNDDYYHAVTFEPSWWSGTNHVIKRNDDEDVYSTYRC